MDGILLLDKPAGLTSHDVVGRVRRALGTRDVGHGGTLDPNATGLLLVAVGRAPRWLPYLPDGKRYRATLRLGLATGTEDIWGEPGERDDAPPPGDAGFRSAIESLTDLAEQVPPMVSALKQGGQRLYRLAREGKTVERKPRPVSISRVQVLALRGDEADFDVDCSAGTYVRTLCVEVGRRLGRPACLAALRRLGHGPFSVDEALPADAWTAEGLRGALIGAERALAHLPGRELSAEEAAAIAQGKALSLESAPQPGAWRLNYHGGLWALADAPAEGPWRLQPKRVFAD